LEYNSSGRASNNLKVLSSNPSTVKKELKKEKERRKLKRKEN
jgi:hypothetical protein